MKKTMGLCFLYTLIFSALLSAQDVVGFWKTISDKTGKAESILGIYEYQGKYYGRLIGTYNRSDGKMEDTIDHPKDRAPGVQGNPFYSGLDIMWDLKKDGNKYTDGKIIDPQKGRIYNAEMWRQDGNLIVRGEVWVFGQNQEWPPALDSDFPAGFKKPDMTKFVPSIPKPIGSESESEQTEQSEINP
jgi:uncharacterized protein (DUF2147 family)